MAPSTASNQTNADFKPVESRLEKVSHVVVEWNLPSEVKIVNLAPLFTTLIKRAETTGTITFLDTQGEAFSVDSLQLLQSDQFIKRFMVESIKARDGSKVLMGFSLRGCVSLEDLKMSISYDWLRKNSLYIRLHPLGFKHGLDMYLLGYFIRIHPRFVCFETLRETIRLEWHKAFEELSVSDDPAIKRQLHLAYAAKALTTLEDDRVQIPVSLEKSVMPGTDSQGKRFSTPVIALRVPKAFFPAATMLMDFCVLAKPN